MNTDLRMLDICALHISRSIDENTAIDQQTLHNFITACCRCYKNNVPFTDNAVLLIQEIEAMYSYSDEYSSKPGFDIGAIYGSLMFLDIYRNQ